MRMTGVNVVLEKKSKSENYYSFLLVVIIKLSLLTLSSQLNNSNKVLQDLNEGGNMIKRIVILCISISVLGILHAQYNPDN
ncbi:MAG: hypothetical protein QF587_02335, partial [Candidatus Marinimicrobia bacterium]|nr:hypothetical protein [Candidatus Neomarinimicrobiota bacterium]